MKLLLTLISGYKTIKIRTRFRKKKKKKDLLEVDVILFRKNTKMQSHLVMLEYLLNFIIYDHCVINSNTNVDI